MSEAKFCIPVFFFIESNFSQAFCWTQSTKPAVRKFGQAQRWNATRQRGESLPKANEATLLHRRWIAFQLTNIRNYSFFSQASNFLRLKPESIETKCLNAKANHSHFILSVFKTFSYI